MTPDCHATAVLIAAAPGIALAFLGDPLRLDQWSFGTWRTILHPDGLVEGRSIFDNATSFVTIEADAQRGTVHYRIGAAPDALAPRIVAHVVAGEVLGYAAGTCVATLLAWRAHGMDDERWRRLRACHEMEILLLRSLIERAAGPGRERDPL